MNTLLIDSDTSRSSLLKRALLEFNYTISAIEKDALHIEEHINLYNPDLIIVGIDLPDTETLKKIGEINTINPRPIVMFAEKDTPKIIQQAIQAGVSAFIVDDIQAQRLPSIINVATARFKEQQALKNELEETKSKLEERKIIEKAKGLIMQQRNINEDEAYKALRKMAMDKGKNLSTVAENIIDIFKVLDE